MFGGAKELERMVVKLLGDNADLEKVIKDSESMIEGMSNKMMAAGTKMTAALTLPISMIGAASIKMYGDFENEMTKSTAIIRGMTGELRSEMEATAISISRNSVTSAEELAKSYYFLASAGMSATQSMKALPIVEKFAVAGAFDMATATDLLTDAQTAFGMVMDDNMVNMKHLGDSLMLAGVQSNATVQQFSEAMTADAGVAARNFGMELETLMALLDAYASSGKKGSEGGNLLGRAIRLTTKSFRAHGAAFEKYGIEVVDKATGKYHNFIDIIGDMEKAFDGMTEPMRDAALAELGFAALAQKSILPLLGMSDAMKDWEREQRKAAGTMEDVVQKQLKSFWAQLTITWNMIKSIAIEIGSRLVPVLGYLNAALQSVVSVWKFFPEWIKTTMVVIAALVAAIGPLLISLALLGKAIVFLMGLAFVKTLMSWGAAAIAMATKFSLLGLAIKGAIAGAVIYAVAQLVQLLEATARPIAEMERLKKLSSQQLDIHSQKTEKIIERGQVVNEKGELDGGEIRAGYLAKQLEVANRELENMDEAAARTKDRLAELTSYSFWRGWSKQLANAAESAEAEESLLTNAKLRVQQQERINRLQDEFDSIDPFKGAGGDGAEQLTEEQRKIVKSVETLTAGLRMEAATFGMTSREATRYALQIKGATEAQLEAAEMLDEKLSLQDGIKKGQEYIDELTDKIAKLTMHVDDYARAQMDAAGMPDWQQDQIRKLEEELKVLEKAQEEKKKQEKERDKMEKEAIAIEDKHKSAKEKMAEAEERLTEMVDAGLLSWETYEEELKAVEDQLKKTKDAGRIGSADAMLSGSFADMEARALYKAGLGSGAGKAAGPGFQAAFGGAAPNNDFGALDVGAPGRGQFQPEDFPGHVKPMFELDPESKEYQERMAAALEAIEENTRSEDERKIVIKTADFVAAGGV